MYTIKTKTSLFILAIASIALTSCGGDKKPETSANEGAAKDTSMPAKADTAKNTVDEMVDFKFHYLTANIASPMATVDALPKAGVAYDKNLINPSENESKYLTSYKKALNFGVYSLDLAYLTTNEQYNMVSKYIVTARGMAKSLDLSETFDKVVGKRLEGNTNNKDTIRRVIDEAYFEVDNYMRSNDRALTATEMLTGSWIESQYITLTLVKDLNRTPKNEILFAKIFEQKKHLTSLVSLLKEYEKVKEFMPLIEKIKDIEKDYSAMKVDDLSNKDFLKKLSDKMSAIRAMVVS